MGVLRYTRYTLTGQLDDLETARSILTEGTSLAASAGPLVRAEWLTALGHCHRERHLRHGDTDALELAIQDYREAVDLTPVAARERPVRLSALATTICERPGITTSSDGSDAVAEAQALHAEAVRLAEPAHAHLAQITANHGSGWLTQFERSGDMADCAAAVHCYERAWRHANPDHPNAPVYLASLSQALRAWLTFTGDHTSLHATSTAR